MSDSETTSELDWIEHQGHGNMKRHMDDMDIYARESHQTLLLLLAGAGGSLVIGVDRSALEFVVTSFYLFGLAVLNVTQCLMLREAPAPFNDPKNLHRPTWTLNRLRRAELNSLQDRISMASQRNIETAVWMNRIRILACLTPLVFGFGCLL